MPKVRPQSRRSNWGSISFCAMRITTIVYASAFFLAGFAGESRPVQAQTGEKASESKADEAAPNDSTRAPLAILETRRVLVMPLQLTGSIEAQAKAKVEVDSAITRMLVNRGLDGMWTSSQEITRSAKRNPTLGVDPRKLAVSQLRVGAKTDKWQLRDPLATQLRTLIALTDARYVLIPVELYKRAGAQDGHPQLALHIVVIDARRSQLQWKGDVVAPFDSASTGSLTSSIGSAANILASLLADLVVPVK